MIGAVQGGAQVQVNEELWAHADLVVEYSGRTLRPPEVLLLARHPDAFAGRVLELGCGGGRLSGYLAELAREFTAIDISPKMVAYCRRAYPRGTFELGDLRDLSRFGDGSLDVVFASFNVLDVLDHDERVRVLADLHRIVAPGGLLMLSSHNLGHAPRIRRPTQLPRGRNPMRLARELRAMPRRIRNRRRLLPLQRREADHAVLVDDAHDFTILHYYIDRDAQERQLAQAGFELVECLDLDGRPVAPGEAAERHAELHYVARRDA